VLISLSEALHENAYSRVRSLGEAFAPYLETPETRASLWAARAVAWERTRQFGRALSAYQTLETIVSEMNTAPDTSRPAPDYSLIKAQLADSMRANHQEQTMASAAGNPEIDKASSGSVTKFELQPAYPNPFNPSTNIAFNIPSKGRVRMEVYNLTGRKVATLTDKVYEQGSYQIRFDVSRFASGIYVVRTHFGGKVVTQKITYLK